MRDFTRARRGGPWAAALAALFGGAASGLLGLCGPFTDTAADAFCPSVLEIFTLGITTGTTATTYSPGDNVTRLQMAAFLSRTVDRVLQRGSRRAVSDQFWTPQTEASLGTTSIGGLPQLVASDGADLWVSCKFGNFVQRVRASDGKLLETWTDATEATGILAGPVGSVFATGRSLGQGQLYRINPAAPAGAVTTVASNLGDNPATLAFDGSRIWTANGGPPPSVSIVTPGGTIPWSVTTVVYLSGLTQPTGILYDGAYIWVTDQGAGTLVKLNSAGGILQTVTVGTAPILPVFDGANIWVPNSQSSSVSVVRAATGAVLATLTGNGLTGPTAAAFDGERILVTQSNSKGLSLWKAADLSPIGSVATSTAPIGACSDGLNFWVVLLPNQLSRF
jgi:hypothetical protein